MTDDFLVLVFAGLLCSFEGSGGLSSISGGYGEGETPLPFPNRAVKPLSADGTWPARARESRSPPVSSVRRTAFGWSVRRSGRSGRDGCPAGVGGGAGAGGMLRFQRRRRSSAGGCGRAARAENPRTDALKAGRWITSVWGDRLQGGATRVGIGRLWRPRRVGADARPGANAVARDGDPRSGPGASVMQETARRRDATIVRGGGLARTLA